MKQQLQSDYDITTFENDPPPPSPPPYLWGPVNSTEMVRKINNFVRQLILRSVYLHTLESP